MIKNYSYVPLGLFLYIVFKKKVWINARHLFKINCISIIATVIFEVHLEEKSITYIFIYLFIYLLTSNVK